MQRNLTFLILALILLAAIGCRGYRVGAPSLYSQDIETVYVPIFKSDSFRQGIAERLTEAVVKRIEMKTSYKVVSRPNADSTLTGELISENSAVFLSNREGDPREKIYSFAVKIQWVDRRQNKLREFDSITWNDASAEIGTETVAIPEFGHSQATVEQTAIDRIADRIVGMMEMPW
ncbi:MAG: LPS assembly lipoprotein LptE [Planctomycetaceae bacterium]|jgi:hypothetical protein|nr:LPS assembly lipoprotein LptE [Planctomycetaceae bacterium]